LYTEYLEKRGESTMRKRTYYRKVAPHERTIESFLGYLHGREKKGKPTSERDALHLAINFFGNQYGQEKQVEALRRYSEELIRKSKKP